MKYSEEQLKILSEDSNYMQVIAAAGSGKTSTMVALLEKLILEGKEKQEEILVITFSRKAVSEIEERLHKRVQNTSIKIKTFHAYCLYILQKYSDEFSGKQIKVIETEEKERVLKDYFKKERFKVGGIPYELLLGGNDFLKNYFPEVYEGAMDIYSRYKKDNGKIDFDDMVKSYLNGLRENKNWAKKARQEVKRVIVDEFQDTDMVQLEWLRLLAPEKICVVGDDWQAIYGFRGASTEPFFKFPEVFSPCKIHFLKTNYRSLPAIINTSAIPISKNKKNIPKKVNPFRKGECAVFRISIIDDSALKYFADFFSGLVLAKEIECMILCRTNFRIEFWKKLGVPEKNLMTIHGSKGLEFKTVFIDLLSGWNQKADEKIEVIEEERRILYVALSRAKDNLYILGNKFPEEDSLADEFYNYFRLKVLELKEKEYIKIDRAA